MKPIQSKFERVEPLNPSQVPGWGVDADPENDPTYPMKKRKDGEHRGYVWKRPQQQPIGQEVLHSIERPNISAVFGTSVAPSGLSGAIRRGAFRFSESSYGHWLPLMLADRVNMIEGVLDDLRCGRVPNIFEEMGYGADWKHDRPRFIKKCAVGVLLAAGIYASLRHQRRRLRRA